MNVIAYFTFWIIRLSGITILGHGRYRLSIENIYGLLGITELWAITELPPRTNLVDRKTYGLVQTMGYHSYGLEQSRL